MEPMHLIEFSVANFRSFDAEVTLSMEPAPKQRARDEEVNRKNLIDTPQGRLLKVAAVYGANASGKSNLVRALSLMRQLVWNSAKEPGEQGLPYEPFRLSAATRAAPTRLQCVLARGDEQVRYGFAYVRERITEEWLYVSRGRAKEQLGFHRRGDVWEAGPAWERDVQLEGRTRPDALHLSVAASWNHRGAWLIRGHFLWFQVFGVGLGLAEDQTVSALADPELGEKIRTLVRRLDFGISDLRVKESKANVLTLASDFPIEMSSSFLSSAGQLNTVKRDREGQEVLFDLRSDESAGTQKVVQLAGPIVGTLARGGVLVIDELDAKLHSLLSLELVRLFQSPETNPLNAQLLFTTHDTTLFSRSLLRRDQLWFVEKAPQTDATTLYSLSEVRLPNGRRVRNDDASLVTDYLSGRYGAVPFFEREER